MENTSKIIFSLKDFAFITPPLPDVRMLIMLMQITDNI